MGLKGALNNLKISTNFIINYNCIYVVKLQNSKHLLANNVKLTEEDKKIVDKLAKVGGQRIEILKAIQKKKGEVPILKTISNRIQEQKNKIPKNIFENVIKILNENGRYYKNALKYYKKELFFK